MSIQRAELFLIRLIDIRSHLDTSFSPYFAAACNLQTAEPNAAATCCPALCTANNIPYQQQCLPQTHILRGICECHDTAAVAHALQKHTTQVIIMWSAHDLSDVLNGLQQQQSSQAQPAASTSAPAPEQAPVTREFTALGSKVVESNVAFKGPEDQQDFWEGEKFDGEQVLGSCILWHIMPTSYLCMPHSYGAHFLFTELGSTAATLVVGCQPKVEYSRASLAVVHACVHCVVILHVSLYSVQLQDMHSCLDV